MKKLSIAACAAAVALFVVTAPVAGSTQDSYKLSAKLTAKQEVPKPTGVRKGAGGTFTGTLKSEKLTFRLTFRRLSGAAQAAHIHLGKRGKAGPVLVALCGPCKSGKRLSVKVDEKTENAIENGRAYVNVHTAKNADGEIRGQVRAKR